MVLSIPSLVTRSTFKALPFIPNSLSLSSRTFSTTNSTLDSSTKLPTTHYRITLRRSAIGLPSRYTKILEALGLHKRLSSVYHLQTPSAAGSILAVKELVHVDNVRRIDEDVRVDGQVSVSDGGLEENFMGMDGLDRVEDHEAVWVDEKGEVVSWGKEARKAPKGYRIIGSLTNEGRNKEFREREEVRKSFGL